MTSRVAALVDAWLSRWVVEPRFVSRHPAERASSLAATLRALPVLSEADWFSSPAPLQPKHLTEGRWRGYARELITWDSPNILAARGLGVEVDTLGPAATRLFPVAAEAEQRNGVWIFVHGWLGGHLSRDLRDWPFSALLDSYDLVHVALPGHGSRGTRPLQTWPTFPARNPFANALGLATASAELRQLVDWLRVRGYERIGVAATSIGANVAALFASVSAGIDQLLLDRPLVSLSEPLRRTAVRRGGDYQALLTQLEAVYSVVDPLLRPLQLPSDRIHLLLGRADGIAGAAAGQALAEHWRVVPDWFEGGHVLPVGRRDLLLRHFMRL